MATLIGQSSVETLLGQGITVWEQGTLIEIPFPNELSGERRQNLHLWTVVRVLQHTSPHRGPARKEEPEERLNLSSDDTLSDNSFDDEEGGFGGDSTQSTLEMTDFKIQQRDPVPEGFVRKPDHRSHSSPKLTLVFLAYDRGVSDVTKLSTLINVSHIAHKVSQAISS